MLNIRHKGNANWTWVRYRLIATKMAQIYKIDHVGMIWSTWHSHTLLVREHNDIPNVENYLTAFMKLNIHLYYNPTTPFLCIFSKKWTYVHKKTCTTIFLGALCTQKINGKKPNVHQLKNIVYSNNRKLYNNKKNN